MQMFIALKIFKINFYFSLVVIKLGIHVKEAFWKAIHAELLGNPMESSMHTNPVLAKLIRCSQLSYVD